MAWAWSELGFLMLTVGWLLLGRGADRLVGAVEGHWDVWRGRGPASAAAMTTGQEER